MKPAPWDEVREPGHGLHFTYPRGVLTGLLFLLATTVLAYFFTNRMGTLGLVVVCAGLIGTIATLFMVVRYPVLVVMVWFATMSGLGTLGMIRMPMIPDFSFPRLFMIIVIVMMPLGAFMGRSLLRPPYWPDVLVVMHTFYVLINLQFISDGTHFHLWYNSNLAPMLAYFFAKQYINNEKQIKTILVTFVLVSAYFWWTSIFEHYGVKSLVWPPHIMDLSVGKVWGGRSRGPFLQSALFGQILGMYLLVSLFMLTRRFGKIWRMLLIANLGIGAVGLFYTYTRGGWLATAVAVIFMAVLRPRIRKMVLVVGLVAVMLGMFGTIQAPSDEFLQERMENTSTIENRLGFLATATRMIRAHPLFGIGYFNYMDQVHLYNQGTNIPFYGYVKRRLGARVPVHDIYLGRAAEEGTISLFLFLAIIAVTALQFLKRWRENPQGEWFDRDTLALMGAICVSYLVGGLIIDYRYFSLVNVLFFFFAGIIVSYPAHQHQIVEYSPTDRSDS